MDGSFTYLPVFETIGAPGVNPNAARLDAAFRRARSGVSDLPPWILDMVGMSGVSYRRFINSLVQATPDARYLEVGSWAGSTMCSAIANNACTALAVDNWSEFGGPAQSFYGNVANAMASGTARVSTLSMDFRDAPYASVGSFNIFLFDGPHTRQDHHDGLRLALPALDDEFVLIIDDWNWSCVRDGTWSAISDAGLSISYAIEVRTTIDGRHAGEANMPINQDSDWHNGYLLAALKKAA